MDWKIWETPFLLVYRDYSGDIVLHERPKLTNSFIFVPPKELEEFCRYYLSTLESPESDN